MDNKIKTYTDLSGIQLVTIDSNGRVVLRDKSTKYTTKVNHIFTCLVDKDGLRVRLIDKVDKEPETAFIGSDILADIDAGVEDYGQV